jgi:hypothetical protein
MSFVRILSVCCVFALFTACGGSNTSPTQTTTTKVATCSGGNKGSVVARINGAAWTATCVTTASYTSNIFSLGATDGVQTIGLGLSFVGFGDYTMTPIDPKNPPQSLMLANGLVNLLPTSAQSWTANSGTPDSSGTLTLTGISATGATGTFSFTAVATSGTGAAGTKVVTNGGFNVTF